MWRQVGALIVVVTAMVALALTGAFEKLFISWTPTGVEFRVNEIPNPSQQG